MDNKKKPSFVFCLMCDINVFKSKLGDYSVFPGPCCIIIFSYTIPLIFHCLNIDGH